eukprot:TRINITY_DN1132_c0_g2_i1.p1 TRINITY_DN1132_c0_g2~~TRINITY_DN1132_c0_g2_i1.p1  ORF type:complete len:179 (+),score=76.10 TRINITY_DN1132_c0_g2_i1:389-925(+)
MLQEVLVEQLKAQHQGEVEDMNKKIQSDLTRMQNIINTKITNMMQQQQKEKEDAVKSGYQKQFRSHNTNPGSHTNTNTSTSTNTTTTTTTPSPTASPTSAPMGSVAKKTATARGTVKKGTLNKKLTARHAMRIAGPVAAALDSASNGNGSDLELDFDIDLAGGEGTDGSDNEYAVLVD